MQKNHGLREIKIKLISMKIQNFEKIHIYKTKNKVKNKIRLKNEKKSINAYKVPVNMTFKRQQIVRGKKK